MLERHEKLISLICASSGERNEEVQSRLEKLVFAWVQYDDDALMFCNLNAIHNCEYLSGRRGKKSDWKTPLDKRRTIVMLNAEHIF